MLLVENMISLLLLALLPQSLGFSVCSNQLNSRSNLSAIHSASAMKMGLFDGITKAFGNTDFKDSDQRVRASHILIKGENNIETIVDLMTEITDRTLDDPERKFQIFAEVARRESQCSSSTQGGDLGEFSPGTMVKEFDMELFPEEPEETPPVGAIVGPIPTEFGCHVVLVTKRDMNRDQVSPVPHPDRFQR